jgi:hypothetical protein
MLFQAEEKQFAVFQDITKKKQIILTFPYYFLDSFSYIIQIKNIGQGNRELGTGVFASVVLTVLRGMGFGRGNRSPAHFFTWHYCIFKSFDF